MTINRRFLYWGVFLAAAGAVMLVAQGGAIDDDALAQALRLWPVVVIALGVGLLLRRTRLALAGGLVAATMPGLLLGGLVVAAPRIVPDCADIQPASLATRQGTFDGAASVDLKFACGELTVTTTPGDGWRLETGNDAGATATIHAAADRLSVTASNEGRSFGFARGRNTWRLALPTATTLDLAVEVDAGRGRLDLVGARLGTVRLVANAADMQVDLAGATVADLSLSANAARVSLSLPATGDLTATVAVNASALRLCAPSGLGLRIRHEGVLDATTFSGLVRNGGAWESPDYATAIHHADVTATVNVGSVDVNPVGGCQ